MTTGNLEAARRQVFEAAKGIPKTASEAKVQAALVKAYKPKKDRGELARWKAYEAAIDEHLRERRKLHLFEGTPA